MTIRLRHLFTIYYYCLLGHINEQRIQSENVLLLSTMVNVADAML